MELMCALGRQVLLELYHCDRAVLLDDFKTREIMVAAVRLSGATIVTETFHTFSPYGVSGVVVIEESHVTIHTWPEHGYAAVDIFTCGKSIDPWIIQKYLEKNFAAKNVSSMDLRRGILPIPQAPARALEPIVK